MLFRWLRRNLILRSLSYGDSSPKCRKCIIVTNPVSRNYGFEQFIFIKTNIGLARWIERHCNQTHIEKQAKKLVSSLLTFSKVGENLMYVQYYSINQSVTKSLKYKNGSSLVAIFIPSFSLKEKSFISESSLEHSVSGARL